ncbi:DNA repair protein RecN [Francisella philomiragia]|uniref:DNA repair protein RecN n=1 Tax=Francisella philomiragia subsp. philomiragia (strain ATCC 25017 / CCUG 19701 / FSC 153 / O\|nr:DNA repair protein RecN [Francisella philomiragia]AJI48152.1 DNA repair protein RecN [Francisella philomiragia]AJI49650.1 DNA repair protein RecN [Francisella philomiragia]MBK2021366.1 DNA repair protein RecN [Francisella philomiragia]MBK2031346.1 DNA repair protein RecN [Francisella philomiragia]MBK2264226.1 DNA repair protein RecN [Francisella philomiragia]
MLQHLAIKNFAIIKSTEIDFREGMTVLTGETGAGKSILLDALSFVLGARLEKTFLQEGNVTEVSATFCIKDNQKAKRLLDELFVDYENDECTFRRVVNKSKQSRLFINGSVAKATDVKKISDKLVNIYSQNSHQDLLDPKSQLSLLDSFANNDEVLKKVSGAFYQLQKVNVEISELQEYVDGQNSQRELLEYKLDELVGLNLEENEFEELSLRQKDLSSVDDIGYSLNYISNLMYDADVNVIAMLTDLEKEVSKLDEVYFKNLQELISQTKVYAQESYDEAQNRLESLEQDPEELAKIEQRMSEIYDFARKHKVEPSYMYQYIQELHAELESFSQDGEKLAQLNQQKQKLEQEYDKYAQELSQARQLAAKEFSKQVEKNIRSLNIPKGSFVAQILSSQNKTSKGIDECQFMINFNLGEQLAPVRKVASGGELSRIGLSIQAVSAAKRSYPTLVFDEVDVGISGATAEIVGKLLKKLSERLQVLCITHQPQVAAQGHTHLHVTKKYLKDTTESKIIELNQQQRIEEIAKIVGGVDISENTLSHAKELLGL